MSGVGYVPQSRTSIYQLGTLTSPFTRHPMDMTADPGKVGASPNEFYINLGDPAVREAYERRYGPGTAGQTFKQWIGPDNEVRFICKAALTWKYGGGTVDPTEVEITDVQATGDRVWHEYLIATSDGFSAARPVHIFDTSKPHGPVLASDGNPPIHSFWGVQYFEFNDAEQVINPPPPPPPPPVDPPEDPPVDPPPPHVCPPCPPCPPAWQRLPEAIRRDAEKILAWGDIAVGPGKIKGAKAMARRLLDFDAWWEANHPEQP